MHEMTWDPGLLPRAVTAPFPSSPRPQLATLSKEVPEGDDWLHEIKYDGYRILCCIRDGRVRLLTRNGLDWTEKLSRLAASASELPAREAVLDGEIVILRGDGTSDFQALQRTMGGANPSGLTYYLFDALYGDGFDLRPAPLFDRKDLLRSLLDGVPADRLRFSDHVRGHGKSVLERARALGAEGIVSKLRTSIYEPRRTRTWLKVKCSHRQEFVVVGYTEPERSRTGFGALLLGVYDEEGLLLFSGQVGTGFTEDELRDLTARLKAMGRDDSPLSSTPRDLKHAHWVSPELVAEVEFTEWTDDARLRHPSYKGLRFDKPPIEVRRELD
jgi:bifunctional non-homologous end joining protein LigD